MKIFKIWKSKIADDHHLKNRYISIFWRNIIWFWLNFVCYSRRAQNETYVNQTQAFKIHKIHTDAILENTCLTITPQRFVRFAQNNKTQNRLYNVRNFVFWNYSRWRTDLHPIVTDADASGGAYRLDHRDDKLVLQLMGLTENRGVENVAPDWIVQCFTSQPTQYRLYGRRGTR